MSNVYPSNQSYVGAGEPGVTGPYPTQSGIYTPELFSKKLLIKFYTSTVFGQIANTDYEGEIRNQGDTVNIRTVPDIAIFDYTRGDLDAPYTPQPGIVPLLIDKGKAYNVAINDIDIVQADIAYVNKWAEDASEQMKMAIDRDILADIYTDADAQNMGNEAGKISGQYALGEAEDPVEITESNVIEYILRMGAVLDEQDVPDNDRAIVIPTWMAKLVKNSDLKDASLAGDTRSILRTGIMGTIDRFTMYRSNNIHSVIDEVVVGSPRCFYPIACHKSALTFASQFVKNEFLRNQKDFGDLMRGLQVYGYKVIKPEAMSVGYVTRGS